MQKESHLTERVEQIDSEHIEENKQSDKLRFT